MASPLQELIAPESKAMVWVDHDRELALGPFAFPKEVPVPVAAADNGLARSSWMQVPAEGRLLSAHEDRDPEDEKFDGEEALRAYLGNHLADGSPDFFRLIDQVGRCLLVHATFGENREWQQEAEEIFARVRKGDELFDLLVARAVERIEQGALHTDRNEGNLALAEYLLARLMLHGAHLISPATPGVSYDLGVLLHDLAHRLSFDNEKEDTFWREGLSRESRDYLQLAMADEEIRDVTPAYYLLGVNREVLGELEGAALAYEKFLDTRAAKSYPQLREEVTQRLTELRKDLSQK